MGSVPIYSQPLLSGPGRHTTTTTDVDDGGRSRSTDARSASARRISPSGNAALGDRGSGELQQQLAAGNDDARIKRCQTAPGYVSFEDVIDREGRDSARRSSEVDGIIRDPLVRAASRLYALDTARRQPPPRHGRRSPGPMGTRRGSFLHRLVSKYVSPCLGFLASAFLCGSSASASCSIFS